MRSSTPFAVTSAPSGRATTVYAVGRLGISVVALKRPPEFEDRREVKMVAERFKALAQSGSRRDQTEVPIVGALATYLSGW
jgi:Glu-tRNA(Gln) amidotransferase subunit E-like FAD-binding protein